MSRRAEQHKQADIPTFITTCILSGSQLVVQKVPGTSCFACYIRYRGFTERKEIAAVIWYLSSLYGKDSEPRVITVSRWDMRDIFVRREKVLRLSKQVRCMRISCRLKQDTRA